MLSGPVPHDYMNFLYHTRQWPLISLATGSATATHVYIHVHTWTHVAYTIMYIHGTVQYVHVHVCTHVHMYIVVAVPRKDSMSPARANAAPVWALQLICWISM